MSKKTNAAKRKAAKKPARKRITRRGRPNPLKAERRPVEMPGLLGDPVFMGHVAAALFRALEFKGVICRTPEEGTRPCEFCGFAFLERLGRYGCPNCEGKGLAGTGNDGLPDAEERPEAKE